MNIFIHLVAPFVSGKKKIATNDKIKPRPKRKNEQKIKFLSESLDVKKIIQIPARQNIKCFFKSKFDEKAYIKLFISNVTRNEFAEKYETRKIRTKI